MKPTEDYENYPTVGSPQDIGLQLEPMTTYAASYQTPALDQAPSLSLELNVSWEEGVAPRPYNLVVNVTAITTGGGQTYTHQLEESNDNATWYSVGPMVAISAVGVVNIGYATRRRYLRRNVVIAGEGASITNQSWVKPNQLMS